MRKRSRARSSWLAIWADACSLGIEASSVIGLRTMTLGNWRQGRRYRSAKNGYRKDRSRPGTPGQGLEWRPGRHGAQRRCENARPLPAKGAREPDTSCQRRRSTAISTKTKMANEVVTNALYHRPRNYLTGMGNFGSRPSLCENVYGQKKSRIFFLLGSRWTSFAR